MTRHVIKLSDLSTEGIRAMCKCDAAERFTTSRGSVRGEVYLSLQKAGLIEWRGGYRLTELGRGLFTQRVMQGGKAR